MSDKYIAIKKNIEPIKYEINRVINNWFYSNSLKCMLLRKFIYIYREYISIIEEHYEQTKDPEIQSLLKSSNDSLKEFDIYFNEIFLESKFNRCLC
jgi:hypothetical protein